MNSRRSMRRLHGLPRSRHRCLPVVRGTPVRGGGGGRWAGGAVLSGGTGWFQGRCPNVSRRRGDGRWRSDVDCECHEVLTGSPLGSVVIRREMVDSRDMYKSPSHLPEEARTKLAAALNARLADGLDLHSQIKVAHWNIKGPQFAALHPLFETFAVGLALHNDTIAERAVTLRANAYGTARHVAQHSRLPEYPQDTTRDVDHVKRLAERIDVYLEVLRESRALAEELGDTDTADVFTQVVTEFEKHAWFLRASLAV